MVGTLRTGCSLSIRRDAVAIDPEEDILIVLLVAALLAAFVASVVMWGYPALIVGALIAVALAFVVILTLTADGLFPQKTADH
mgnify:CR=1 FL=1